MFSSVPFHTSIIHQPSPLQRPLVLHVRRRVDAALWELGDLILEALFDGLDDRLVIWVADERESETLGSETTGTTDTVEVRVRLVRHVVIDGDVNALNIDTTAEDVSRDTDTGLELLELLVALDAALLLDAEHQLWNEYNLPLFLTDTRMHCGAREVALAEEPVKLGATRSRAHENDDLVELQAIK